MWAALAAAAAQAGMQAAKDSGWLGYSHEQSYTKLLEERQKELQEWQARELPTMQREGLEQAGYNPLLAIGFSELPPDGVPPPGTVPPTLPDI